MLLPLCSNGSLQSVIDSAAKSISHFGFNDVRQMTTLLLGCAEGLQAIHKAGYRHGDFKPSNILLVNPLHAVITDFGSVSDINIIITNRTMALKVQEDAAIYTTAPFRSPELFNTPSQCVVDGKADVWSLGCTIYNCMFGHSPFESKVEGLSVLAVMSGSYQIPRESSQFPKEYFELIARCLTVDLFERITIDEAVNLLSVHTRNLLDARIASSVETSNCENSKLSTGGNSPTKSQQTKDIAFFQQKLPVPDTTIEFETNFADFESLHAGEQSAAVGNNDEEFGDFASADVSIDVIEEGTTVGRRISRDQSEDNSSDIDTRSARDVLSRNEITSSNTASNQQTSQFSYNDEFRSKMIATPLPMLLKRLFSDLLSPGYIIKSTTVNVLRKRGLFPKKLVKKTVNLILTQHYIVIRKTSDVDSKIHSMILLSSRMGLTCTDSLNSVGLNGLIIQGDAIQEFYPAEEGGSGSPIRSYSGMSHGRNSNSSLTMYDDTDHDKDGGDGGVGTMTSNTWALGEFELSFDSKDLLNDWIESIDKQRQQFVV